MTSREEDSKSCAAKARSAEHVKTWKIALKKDVATLCKDVDKAEVQLAAIATTLEKIEARRRTLTFECRRLERSTYDIPDKAEEKEK